MPDEPEILRDLVTPVQPVRRPGSERTRGVREGLVLAVILVFAALGAGILAVPRPPAGASTGPSEVARASASPTPSTAGPGTSIAAPTPELRPTAAVEPVRPCPTGYPEGLVFARVIADGQWAGLPLAESWMAQPLPSYPQGDPDGPDVAPGAPLVISTDYHACALAWSITLDGIPVSIQDNPLHDPAFAAQNYFVLTLPAVRDPDPRLRAELLFSKGWAGFEWTLHFHPSPIPDAFFAALDQTIEAAPGCGFTITLAGGSAAVDECATTIPADGYGPYWMWVPPSARVAFRVPNAVFEQPDPDSLRCGTVDGQPPDFRLDPSCALAIQYDPSNALTFLAPAVAGRWWIEIRGCASRDGIRACGLWFALIDTAEPMPTDPGFPD